MADVVASQQPIPTCISPGHFLEADVVYVQCKSAANTYMYHLDSYLRLM